MTFEFSNHVVKYDMPTLVNCARYGVPIPDDTCVLLGQALFIKIFFLKCKISTSIVFKHLQVARLYYLLT